MIVLLMLARTGWAQPISVVPITGTFENTNRVVATGGGVPGWDVIIESPGAHAGIYALEPNVRLNNVRLRARAGGLIKVTIDRSSNVPNASFGFVGTVFRESIGNYTSGYTSIELLRVAGTMDVGGQTVAGRLGDGLNLSLVSVNDIKEIIVTGDILAPVYSFAQGSLVGEIDTLVSNSGNILGIINSSGSIGSVRALSGRIGPTSGSVINVYSGVNIGLVEAATSINANIGAGVSASVSAPGDLQRVNAPTVRGTIVANNVPFSFSDPFLTTTNPLNASVWIKNDMRRRITTPNVVIPNQVVIGGQSTGLIQLNAGGLQGSILIGSNVGGNVWLGNVTVGGVTLSPKPAYEFPSSTWGGGQVAAVPFNHYVADSGPTTLPQGLFNQGGNVTATGLEMAFYGPVFTPGTVVNGVCQQTGIPFDVELVSPSGTATLMNSMVEVSLPLYCEGSVNSVSRFVVVKGKANKPMLPTPDGWTYRVNIGSSSEVYCNVFGRIDPGTRVRVVPKIVEFTLLPDCDKDGIADDPMNPPPNCDRWGGCAADFNFDAFLDFFDQIDFLDAYENGDLAADFNGDNFLDFFDIDSFTTAFETGCGW